MKSVFLNLLIFLFFVPLLVYCQKSHYKIYKHQALGIQIKYYSPDEFCIQRKIETPFLEWKTIDVRRFKLKLKLPPGFILRTAQTDLPPSGPIYDTLLFRYSADIIRIKDKNHKDDSKSIHLHFTNMEFPEIALEDGFVKEDSIRWVIDSGMMGREKANYLDGTIWKGLRGMVFSRSGSYTQNCYIAIMVYKYDANCNLVLRYYDSQLDENVLSEIEFYDIVSSINFYKKQ